MWEEEELADKTIIDVKVKSPSVWLKAKEGGWVEIRAEGDCCSQAFIDAVRLQGTPKLTGKFEDISFPSHPTVQEVDEVIAVRLDGEKGGSISIVHRNSSNGYYGNYLCVNSRSDPPDDAVDGKEWYRDIR